MLFTKGPALKLWRIMKLFLSEIWSSGTITEAQMRAIGDMSVAHVAHQNTIRADEWDLNT